jgi:hypothetical protein
LPIYRRGSPRIGGAQAVLDLPGVEEIPEVDVAWLKHIVAITEPDPTARVAPLEESLPVWRRLGDREGLVGSLNNLAIVVQHVQGNLTRARTLYEEALEVGGDSPEAVPVLANLAFIALTEGDTATLETLAGDLIAVGTAGGSFYKMWGLTLASVVALERSDLHAARSFATESLELATRLGVVPQMATGHTLLALCDIQSQDLDSATDHIIRACEPDLEGGGDMYDATVVIAAAIIVIGAFEGLAEAAELSASLPTLRLSPSVDAQVQRVLRRARHELGSDRYEQIVHPDSVAPPFVAIAKAHSWLVERTGGQPVETSVG